MLQSPRRATAVLIVLVFALAGCAGDREGEAAKPNIPLKKPAVKAPEMPAADLPAVFAVHGAPVKLTDLKGKVVLLDLWAVWCGPCLAAFPHLREWHKSYAAEGLEVVGATTYWGAYDFDKESGRIRKVGQEVVDEDTGRKTVIGGLTPAAERDMLRAFAAHHQLDYRVLLYAPAEWAKTTQALQVRAYPTVVLFDRQGKFRASHVGGGAQTARQIEADIRKLLAEK
jgi:thiol-disulfide isomerase/thioredoxin